MLLGKSVCMAGPYVLLALSWSGATLAASDTCRGGSVTTCERGEEREEVRLVIKVKSVRPVPTRHPRMQWIAECSAQGAGDEVARKEVRIFMHSPVLEFHVPADELVGRRFQIVVLDAVGDDIVGFRVENEVDRDE